MASIIHTLFGKVIHIQHIFFFCFCTFSYSISFDGKCQHFSSHVCVWCSCFIGYREADESRLREVCESLLGPPTGMAGDALADTKNLAWDPCVLVRHP